MDDFETIENMINEAEGYGLLVEIIYAFGMYRAAGYETKLAADMGLLEFIAPDGLLK